MKQKISPWLIWAGVLLAVIGLARLPAGAEDDRAVAAATTASTDAAGPGRDAAPDDDGAAALAQAFADRRSDLQVESRGTVIKVLPDDLKGSRHQRFLLRLSHGQVLLVAHNIDLAPRIESLREGDEVAFAGEYEWTEKGGVMHWTHHDPAGRHPGGWLLHDGRRYE